jgi:hypothetical protein
MADAKDLDRVIHEMYEQVSFEPGRRPDWTRQREIFAPDARLVRITDEGVFEFTLESYAREFDRMIESGEMPGLWEGEVWRETFLLGDMAQVLSGYETRRTRSSEVFGRGVNGIQLFQRGGRWWISAMIWRREGKTVRMPERPR